MSKSLLVVAYFYLLSCCLSAVARVIQNASIFSAMAEVPTFNGASSSVSSDCSFSEPAQERGACKNKDFPVKKPPVVFNLKHSSAAGKKIQPLDSLTASAAKDSTRIQRLHSRIVQKMQKSSISDKNPIIRPAPSPEYSSGGLDGRLVATLESGVSLGSGEYFMDVFVGTPPRHFSLILDTGSDLNWIQCVPCHDCFDQTGPYYDPNESSSYRNVGCRDPRCGLVSSPEPPVDCRAQNQSCPYYYWYGDSSNTTGDFAVETFTVNLTGRAGGFESFGLRRVENVMFGCGHWNRGLFHGAAGLLGLGRGPLSFASQLQSLYGHSFSYCLVDRNSNSSVSSKLIFGEDKDLMDSKEMNFTGLVGPNEGPGETFYYVGIKSIVVGGEVLEIPNETWGFSSEGGGGTIVDSGTTLTYFVEPAYRVIKEAFVKKVLGYPFVEDFPILGPCYNVSGMIGTVDLPTFSIVFGDGAVWSFPVENYFIRLDPEDVLCLAILGTPRSGLSIIGNYQQQNFRVVYDTKRSRLGFAPARCASM
ncbi:Eukaryotic aspartyl protease family protein [Striga hermonthica]|uniref:Eukaryotic aspartyl protease family protein n=1 Tax=Striga hermonthica TaxID=68872 RepID=A0A9N7R2M6_STRHE|nr:Eukaryotic aspartyl protease family protein [Striga hermonthica]